MRQTEKNQRSRERILTAAFGEFADHGYDGSGLNQICQRGQISKGLLYHYYDGKDALYAACVERLFREMTEDLRAQLAAGPVTVRRYFTARTSFFRRRPQARQLFADVLRYPRSRLAAEIARCRAPFDAYNREVLAAVLAGETLRPGVTTASAAEQFRLFADFLGVALRAETEADVEQKTAELLETMLYGLIARPAGP